MILCRRRRKQNGNAAAFARAAILCLVSFTSDASEISKKSHCIGHHVCHVFFAAGLCPAIWQRKLLPSARWCALNIDLPTVHGCFSGGSCCVVSSHTCKAQHFKTRVANSRVMSCLHLNVPFNRSKTQGLGPIFQIVVFDSEKLTVCITCLTNIPEVCIRTRT